MSILVVNGNRPSFMGCDWLQKIQLDWSELHHIQSETKLQEVLSQHASVFKEELGYLQGMEIKIFVDPKATPDFEELGQCFKR